MITKKFYIEDVPLLSEGPVSGTKVATIDFKSEEDFQSFWEAVLSKNTAALEKLEDAKTYIDINGKFYENLLNQNSHWKTDEEKLNKNKIYTVFIREADIEVGKAFGHKECCKYFETKEEQKEFIQKVKQKDEKALEELERDADLLVDEYDTEDYELLGEWEVY